MINVTDFKNTLDKISNIKSDFYIPSHSTIITSQVELQRVAKMNKNEEISNEKLFEVKRNGSFKYFKPELRLRLEIEAEFETMETRSADPFHISEEAKQALHEAYKYWGGKTTSELASSYMEEETLLAMKHNIFTPGNYFYNGIGHFTVKYGEVLEIGYEGIIAKAQAELDKLDIGDADFGKRSAFLRASIMSCQAAIDYAKRYALLALEEAQKESDPTRKLELLKIAKDYQLYPSAGSDRHAATDPFIRGENGLLEAMKTAVKQRKNTK